MKRTFFIIFLTGASLLSSCSEKKPALENQVMAIHDSIMPRMSEIMSLEEKLSLELKKTDSLRAVHPSDTAMVSRQGQLQSLITNLKAADDSMIHWMHSYKADTLSKLDEKQAELYLQNQKNAIENVRDQMQQSIKEAQAFQP